MSKSAKTKAAKASKGKAAKAPSEWALHVERLQAGLVQSREGCPKGALRGIYMAARIKGADHNEAVISILKEGANMISDRTGQAPSPASIRGAWQRAFRLAYEAGQGLAGSNEEAREIVAKARISPAKRKAQGLQSA